MNMLALNNFADNLDLDLLDQAQMLQQSGQIKRLVDEGEQVWSASFKSGPTASVSLGKAGRIEGAVCTCEDYDELAWDENPCVHIAATYYALREKESAEKPAVKRGRKPGAKTEKPLVIKPAPRPKDPAEALLRDLEPIEVVEFLRQILTKNKEIKSQFLLHFSEKNTGSAQFDEIVVNAIAAVKGRRKYLSASDGSKIATTLLPMIKQAAAAEARGLFREAYAAAISVLRHIPDVFQRLENASTRLNGLYEQACELLALIVENSQTPFELRDEIVGVLFELYGKQADGMYLDAHTAFYNLVRRAARVTKRVKELAWQLQLEAGRIPSTARRESWSPQYYQHLSLLQRLYQLYDEELADPKAALDLLERHKNFTELYRLLIRKKIELGDYKGAVAGIEDLQKNTRKYDSWGLLHQLNGLLVEVYNKSGDRQKMIQLAGRLFRESGYVNFDYFEMEKAAYQEKEWSARVDALLREVAKTPVLFGSTAHPTYEILAREKRWPALHDALLQKTTQVGIWGRYGALIAALYPDDFFRGATKAIDTALTQANPMLYTQIAALLKIMLQVEGKAEATREFIAEIRARYGNRPALLSALNQIE